MMNKKKFFLVSLLMLLLSSFNKTNAQQTNIAIVLNEYSVGNYSIADNFGYTSDWVEIHNAWTNSVSLAGYYLSNDRSNLYKWKFPTTFTLAVNDFGIVYLSGRNMTAQVGTSTFYHHASFNIDQCKKQWLILTSPQGVVRDSVAIQRTKAGHTRGRIDYNILGIEGWRLYPVHSFSLGNPNVNYYKDYLPQPVITPPAGWGHNGKNVEMFLPGTLPGLSTPYDSSDSLNCYQIHYTTNGDYPTPADPIYGLAAGEGTLMIMDNQVFRAVTYPKTASTTFPAYPYCFPEVDQYLPSFCETNTYFSETNGSFDNLDPRFGVLSIAMNTSDLNWFNSGGSNNPANTPIGHVEYFDNKQQKLEGYTSLNRPVSESWSTLQRGFYLSIDDRRGFGCNFEGKIFNDACLGTTTRSVFPTLHVHAGDNESHSLANNAPVATGESKGTGIRDVFIQSLAAKNNIKVNPLHMKPIVTFINGNYQGVYNLREVYDKYYETYYNNQLRDSLYMEYYYGIDGFVYNYIDDTQSSMAPLNKFRSEVTDYVVGATKKPMNNTTFYNTLMGRLDKESFIDYMIINNYSMNSDLWNYNIAFAKGTSEQRSGDKWHYYLWNMPAIFNFTAVPTNTLIYSNPLSSPCQAYASSYPVSAYGGNSHGNILRELMNPITGNQSFQLEYKNRFQDLLNGPLKCDKILAHFDCVVDLYGKEMRYHEDFASTPQGAFYTNMPPGTWDTNIVHLRKTIEKRCAYMSAAFSNSGCYGMFGPLPISVNVFPENAGSVKLNSNVLPNYRWEGQYFQTQLSFKAIPSNTASVFHHWEFKNHAPKNNAPLSLDSLAIDFTQAEEVLAVFTDVTTDIEMPTGFSPNGDGRNDEFKPLGSALFTSEYEFRIWNRWGQEVFRSTDPNKGWDGYYENRQALTGVYAYVITYKNVYNEAKVKKGNVTLVR
jgi:gliding motility-associated-like protein